MIKMIELHYNDSSIEKIKYELDAVAVAIPF